MTTIIARDLLKEPREHIWDLQSRHDITHIEMDDGVHETYNGEIILSRYAWIFQEQFPDTPLTIDMLHKERYFGTAAFQKLLNNSYWACFYANGQPGIQWRERRWKTMYRVINALFNDVIIHCAEYVRGACALDYLEIMDIPEIAAIRQFLKTKPRILPRHFIEAYAQAKKIILNDPRLDDNPLAIAVRCGSIKMDQLIQVVIARGYCADADSRIFNDPVRDGYMDGIRSLEAVLMDSRTATRAVYYQKKPTQDSEYLNRRLQLLSAIYKKLYEMDCGSKGYREVFIDSKETLRDYAGKNHWVNGMLTPLKEHETQHVGKILKIRSVFNCKHPDRYGVCMACFGAIGLNVPDLTNLGHTCVSTVLGRFVQLLLSAKHIILSAVGGIQDLGASGKTRLLKVNDDPTDNHIYLTEFARKSKMLLTLGVKEARMISDLHEVKNIEELSVTRMSAIRTFLLSYSPEAGMDDELPELIDLRHFETATSLSMDMLKYIIEHGYATDEMGNFVVDLANWDENKPFLFVPVTQFSIPMYIAGIETYIVSASNTKGVTKKEIVDEERIQEYIKGKGMAKSSLLPRITDYESPIEACNQLYSIISQKMDVNIAHLEVMVLSLTAEDASNGDFRPPLDREKAKIISYTQAMRFRSMSQLFAHEEQNAGLYEIQANLVKHRADHPYDELFRYS